MLRLMPITYEFMGLAFRNKLVQKAFKTYLNRYMEFSSLSFNTVSIQANSARQMHRKSLLRWEPSWKAPLLLWVYDKSLVDPEKHIRSGMKLLLKGVQAEGKKS